MVVNAFESSPRAAKVIQWACGQESHRDGGTHYHLAIKLDKCQRWLRVRNHLATVNNINVHFSDTHYNYYSAWRYATKEDVGALQSDGHSDL